MNYFVINAKLPSLNQYINACRTNPFGGAQFKRNTEKIIKESIEIYKDRGVLIPTDQPINVRFDWHEKTKRRDSDNIASAKKYILDAMQTCDIIPNDNRNYIKGFSDNIIDDNEDYVLVVLTPVEELKKEENRIVPGIFYIKEKNKND